MTDTLLLVDDDEPFRLALSRALDRRGFATHAVGTLSDAVRAVSERPYSHAVLDLRLEDGNGMELVDVLRDLCPRIRIVMLTGYGNIASAVSAIKAGAVDYLPKPVDVDRLKAALTGGTQAATDASPSADPMTPDRVRWEHIQRVLEESGQNVSETARRLKMHRRTLQRILGKHAPT